jgi:membrane protease YdiL (CAAX protease family)
VSRVPPPPPPPPPPPADGSVEGPRAHPAVTVGDGLVLVAWLVLGQILLYGIALGVGAVDQTGGTGDRFVQVAILSAVLASTLAWLGIRGRLSGALAPVRTARARDLAIGIGAGVAGFVVLLVALGLVFQFVGFDPPEQQALDDVVAGGVDALLAVTMAVLLAPVLEEIVFRGALHQGLRHRAGFWPAALISSGVFAAVHLEVVLSSPIFLVQLFLLGVLFAWLLERTGNLAAPIAAHLVFNAISMGLAVLGSRFEDLAEVGAVVVPRL